MKYTRPMYENEEIEVNDVIAVSMVKVAHVAAKVVDTNGDGVVNENDDDVMTTQVSVDISNLF